MYNLLKNAFHFHNFEKQNLPNIKHNEPDRYVCSYCKMKAKSAGLERYLIAETYKETNVFSCAKAPEKQMPKTVKVTHTILDNPYINIVIGNTYEVIDAPAGETNGNGLWVLIEGQPVKLYPTEFIVVS